MGRNRTFDEADVVRRSARLFLSHGYEGTSIDELLTATGLHRGSLYRAFGSKRGLFLACLEAHLTERDPGGSDTLDLVLVALLELAPRDKEVRAALRAWLTQLDHPDLTLGARLLQRAHITTKIPGEPR
ncbi:MAG: TetR/AcrR family transcriptional regulator [Actinomycetota bacterium]|nr:TetR/AcrR family transcriptional regulator [Actinomycetota bacterium]